MRPSAIDWAKLQNATDHRSQTNRDHHPALWLMDVESPAKMSFGEETAEIREFWEDSFTC